MALYDFLYSSRKDFVVIDVRVCLRVCRHVNSDLDFIVAVKLTLTVLNMFDMLDRLDPLFSIEMYASHRTHQMQ